MTYAAGVVRFGPGEELARGETLYGRGWLELEQETRVVIQHDKTAPEWTLDGPALAAFCPRGRDEILLASGRLASQQAAGNRSSGKMTVGTPFGTIVHAGAGLELRVSREALWLHAGAGEAWLTPPGPAPGRTLHVTQGQKLRRTQRYSAADAEKLCLEVRQRLRALTRALPQQADRRRTAGHPATEPELERVLERERASCASAGAAALLELRAEEREEPLSRLSKLEQRWHRVPSGVQILF